MNRAISLALIVSGVVSVVFGVGAAGSFRSDESRFFAGTPADKAAWMLVAGVVAAPAGNKRWKGA